MGLWRDPGGTLGGPWGDPRDSRGAEGFPRDPQKLLGASRERPARVPGASRDRPGSFRERFGAKMRILDVQSANPREFTRFRLLRPSKNKASERKPPVNS